MPGGPGLFVSASIFLAALVCAVLANLQMRRPYERRVRGVPWLAIQFVAVVICFTLILHMAGLITGHEFKGRAPY